MPETFPYKNYPILFIDDEEWARSILKKTFERDFTIHIASNGEEALKTIETHPEIVLVVSDQRMPQMTGLEFIALVSQKRPDLVNVLVTAYSDLSLVVEALNKGNLYRYITKPYEERELRQALIQGIERYHLVEERNRLYAQHLESMKREAEMKRLAEIGTLSASVVHNINNSLVAVNSFLRMIPQKREEGEGVNTDFWESFYFVALNEISRIQEMVGRLLRSAKWSEKEEPFLLNLKRTDLNTLLDETVLLVENEAHKKGVEVRRESETLPNCLVEPVKIREVFMNLLFNAIHATSQGFILVKSSLEGESVVKVSIADTGVGISEENLRRLFIPFFSTKGDKGVGLGLMMCRDLIEKHRGSIDVKSEVGVGTTVTVSLPVYPIDRRTS